MTNKGYLRDYVQHGVDFLSKKQDSSALKIQGSGLSTSMAIKVAEYIRNIVPNLQSIIDISHLKVEQEQYLPEELRDSAGPQTFTRFIACVNIILSNNTELDPSHAGY